MRGISPEIFPVLPSIYQFGIKTFTNEVPPFVGLRKRIGRIVAYIVFATVRCQGWAPFFLTLISFYKIQYQSFCNLFLHFRSTKISGLRPSDFRIKLYSTKISGLRPYGSRYYLRSTTIWEQSSFGSDSSGRRFQGYAQRNFLTFNDKWRAGILKIFNASWNKQIYLVAK